MRTGISLGSNLGDRMAHLSRGRKFLETLGTGPILVSRVYETEPVGCTPGTPAFLNAAVEIEFTGTPHALLAALQTAEAAEGRPADHGKNTPRTLDLDILYCGDASLETATLAIPHPRLRERRFVLAPLCDIRPGLALPGFGETVADLLAKLPAGPHVKLHAESF